MSPPFLEALLGGRHDEATALLGAHVHRHWPDEHDARWLSRRLEQMRRDAGFQRWVRAVVARGERAMCGHAGFHGPPGVNGLQKPGALELGYTTFPRFRGRGYATEAASALLDWARRERGVRSFVASAAPGNEPSLAILRKLGFVQTGEQWDDEDGLELVFELV